MLVEQPPHFVRLLWPGLWRKSGSEKCVYLTFDDGPHPELTDYVLALLEKYNIKATFFCVGDNVRKYPEVFERIKTSGHDVGNHTMHHLRGFEHSCEVYLNDVAEAQGLIQSHFFRPPHGRVTFKQLRALKEKYTIVMWDVITRDYNQKLKPEQVFNIVKKYTRNGSVIVFHDSDKAGKNLLGALEPSIIWLKEQGYVFKKLED